MSKVNHYHSHHFCYSRSNLLKKIIIKRVIQYDKQKTSEKIFPTLRKDCLHPKCRQPDVYEVRDLHVASALYKPLYLHLCGGTGYQSGDRCSHRWQYECSTYT